MAKKGVGEIYSGVSAVCGFFCGVSQILYVPQLNCSISLEQILLLTFLIVSHCILRFFPIYFCIDNGKMKSKQYLMQVK